MISKPARLARVRTLAVPIVAAAVILFVLPSSGGAYVRGRTQPPAHANLGVSPLGQAIPRTPSIRSTLIPGSVTLDGSPGFPPVADASTNTLYVPIQCQNPSTNASCNQTASHVLDLIDSATCKASSGAGCDVVATAAAGDEQITATLDHRTDTMYVGDTGGGGGGGGAITVIDGVTCNVSVRSGCSTPLATIKLGSAFPTALALDPATGTLYVANPNGSVDVLDVSHCNATSTASCGSPIKSIADGLGPVGVAVDIATDSVYAANGANGESSHTVSVIDGATCNATQQAGCGQTPTTASVGTNPEWDAVDQATNTVYIANTYSGSVSLLNGATCNGTDASGCGQTAVPTGSGDGFLELDESLHTLFVLNQDSDTMSEINLHRCNAQTPSLCPAEARNEQVAFNPPTGGEANSLAIAGGGHTAYVVNAGGPSLLQPISIGGCDARDTAGCRVEAPHVAQTEFYPVVDAATHTIYAGNVLRSGVDVFDADTCRAGDLTSCSPVAVIPTVGPQANLEAIDDATHTLYVGNPVTDLAFDPAKTISVVNIAHCGAGDTSGCNAPAPTITVGLFPGPPTLDPATDTLYEPYGGDGNHLAVINTRHCNAEDDSGCGRRPVKLTVPPGVETAALSQTTDSVYLPAFFANKIAVLDGATCNSSDHSGCGHFAALFSTGPAPSDVLVNDATDTAYVTNGGDGDSPGSVSIINTQECNGSQPGACGQNWPSVAIGRQPQQLALDPATGEVYVADQGSAGVSVIDGNACNATTTSGCRSPEPLIPTAGGPSTLAVAPWSDTVYATEGIGAVTCCGGVGLLGVFKGRP